MNRVKLSDVAKIELSSIDKKISNDEIPVKLCNFTDVYYNWAITTDVISSCMNGSVKESEYKKLVLKKGQVAITKDSETRDDIGMPCYIADNFDNAVLAYHCALITPNNDLLSGKYLNALLNTSYARKSFENQAGGSGQRYTLSKEAIENIQIHLPPIEIQKLLGSFFSNIDKKIQNNKKQIETLESLAKTIYDYWFVQFDFPNEEGKPYKSSGGKMVWNEELKREIPEGWDVVRYGDIMSFAKGKIPVELSEVKTEKCCMPYITINVANQGPYQYCSPQTMVSCKGETIMVMDGAASGDVYVGNKGALGSTFSMISTKRTDITDAFIYRLLKYSSMIYKRANTGSTVPHANRNFIEKMYVALPRDCRKLINVFNLINDKIIATQEENRELTSLRDFLLPMLMNGQVKVGKESA